MLGESNVQTYTWLKAILAFVSTASFFTYHLLLDQHYRLNSDEFACMSYAKEGLSGFGYAWRFYLNREGNFLTMFIQGLGMKALAEGFPPAAFLFLLKFILWIVLNWFVRVLFKRLGSPVDASTAVLAASGLQTTLYLISSNQPEIWHWAMGSVVYLPPIVFVLLSATFLLRDQVYAAMIPMAFIMQSRATYAVLFFGAIAFYFLYDYLIHRTNAKRNLMLTLVLLCILLIYVFAPGNNARLPHESFSSSFLIGQFIREIKGVVVSFNIAKLDRVAIGLLVTIPLLPRINWSFDKRWVFLPGLLYLVFVLAHAALFVLATGYASWSRVLSMHSFLFLSVSVFYAYFFYRKIDVKHRYGLIISAVAFIILSMSLYRDFPVNLDKAEVFSKAYDQRWERIFAFEGGPSDTLMLERLPDPGVLCYFPFGEDPDYWINSDFRKAYQLEFKVALEKEDK